MVSDSFGFFERSLAEQRTYKAGWDKVQGDVVKAPGWAEHFEVLDQRTKTFTVRGRHVMRPGHPLGLAQVNERFDITLPSDIDAFYRRWNGGLLLFQRFYQILSVQEIIEHQISAGFVIRTERIVGKVPEIGRADGIRRRPDGAICCGVRRRQHHGRG